MPGRSPHPVRDPAGHSYPHRDTSAETAPARSELVRWGADLFNHGYYWEAHEAWEALWQSSREDPPLRQILKGLILLAATGIKVREGKRAAALHHGGKAYRLFQGVDKEQFMRLKAITGLDVDRLAECARVALPTQFASDTEVHYDPVPIFSFVLDPGSPDNS